MGVTYIGLILMTQNIFMFSWGKLLLGSTNTITREDGDTGVSNQFQSGRLDSFSSSVHITECAGSGTIGTSFDSSSFNSDTRKQTTDHSVRKGKGGSGVIRTSMPPPSLQPPLYDTPLKTAGGENENYHYSESWSPRDSWSPTSSPRYVCYYLPYSTSGRYLL